jgi:hypothetical protein
MKAKAQKVLLFFEKKKREKRRGKNEKNAWLCIITRLPTRQLTHICVMVASIDDVTAFSLARIHNSQIMTIFMSQFITKNRKLYE